MSPTETAEARPKSARETERDEIWRSVVRRLAMSEAGPEDFIKAAEPFVQVQTLDAKGHVESEYVWKKKGQEGKAGSEFETLVLQDIDDILSRLDRKIAVEREAVDALLARAQKKAG